MGFFVFSLFVMACCRVFGCQGTQMQYKGFISWDDMSVENYSGNNNFKDGPQNRVILVSKDGSGDSSTVQGAVNMVPDGNKERVKIFISPGVYSLKWTEWQNTAQGAVPGAIGMQAVALRLSGDKAMLYRCRILGSQDTLFDHMGRHYFFECYVQGSIDFIFGNARSLYQGCRLHAVAMSYGAVAASQRDSPEDNSGFSFLDCRLDGSGILYLGRAWGRYARVVYSYCQLEGIITPEGWSDWGDPSRTRTVWFGEFNCSGKGANLRKRVQWARSLNYDEARPFLGPNYIDGNQWLRL